MAGVADKARFYLERSVPQLREWEQKEIFSKVRRVGNILCIGQSVNPHTRIQTLTSHPGRNPVYSPTAQRFRA